MMKGNKAARGKAAVCPFCHHTHAKATHTRLMAEGYGRDVLLVAADIDPKVSKRFRAPTSEELVAADSAPALLRAEADFAPGLPAVPAETIPAGNNDTVRPSMYGARTYGDLWKAGTAWAPATGRPSRTRRAFPGQASRTSGGIAPWRIS